MKKGWLKNWFTKVFKGGSTVIQEHADEAVHILEIIKKVINNPAADVLVMLTKNNIDNVALDRLRQWVPQVIGIIDIMDDFNKCVLLKDPDEQLKCILANIPRLKKIKRDAFYLQLAVGLLKSKMLTEFGVHFNSDDLAEIIQGRYKDLKLSQVFHEPTK